MTIWDAMGWTAVFKQRSEDQDRTSQTSHLRFPTKKYGTEKKLIGQGVSCHVYLYSLPTKNGATTTFAVKSFVKKNLRDADELESIRREISIHRKVNDSFHVVKLIDSFSLRTKSQYFIILEYMPFNLLDLYLKYGSIMPQVDRLCYFKQIVNCLSYLQSQNVGHRDIKLENCCVGINGNIKLIDFGSSTIGNVGYGMAGSPSYSAPEIHNCLKYDSFICDVWSLGIVLVNLFFVSKQKWKNARHDDPIFTAYKSNSTIENVVRQFSKNSDTDEEYISQRHEVGDLILKLLTVDVEKRITLQQLTRQNTWFQNVSCCHLQGHEYPSDAAGHSHHRFLIPVN